MSISVSSALATASLAAAEASSTSSAMQNTQQTASAPVDTVKLSMSQQINQLYSQGQSVSEIASNLALTVDDVNLYLGITTPSGG
jgi:DNA-binding NarL/FixJ family response regulator